MEFDGFDVLVYTNGVFYRKVATTNEIVIPSNPYGASISTLPFLSSMSNQVMLLSTGNGITFQSPEAYTNRENKITLHLKKEAGGVVWFPNLTWVYGESPDLIPDKTHVFKFESVDGINWRGYFEYSY